MASAPLVEQQIKYGNNLLNALKELNFDIDAALWWYSPEAQRWMLLIATPDVDTSGPTASYQRLHKALTRSPEMGIHLNEPSISLIDPKHPLLSALRDYFRQDQPAQRTQIKQNMINGYALEGAYVYWL